MTEIYYIGGSPCSGKSTVAEMLVEKYGFQYFRQDDFLQEYIDRGAGEGRELFQQVSRLSMDEMWMRDPMAQCTEEIALYETMFSYSIDAILTLSQKGAVLAEGAGFMPRFVKGIHVDKSRYICMVPTKKFQVTAYAKRTWVSGYLSVCKDPNKAFENWMERDAVFAKTVRREAEDLGYPILMVDGASSIEENLAAVERAFQLHTLHETPGCAPYKEQNFPQT